MCGTYCAREREKELDQSGLERARGAAIPSNRINFFILYIWDLPIGSQKRARERESLEKWERERDEWKVNEYKYKTVNLSLDKRTPRGDTRLCPFLCAGGGGGG